MATKQKLGHGWAECTLLAFFVYDYNRKMVKDGYQTQCSTINTKKYMQPYKGSALYLKYGLKLKASHKDDPFQAMGMVETLDR